MPYHPIHLWKGFVLCLLSVSLSAQVDYTVNIKLLDRSHGLSSNNIFDIVKDSRGNMWVATYSGLNHFDGEQFVKTPVEGGAAIHQLEEDDQGFLWLITGYEIRNYNVRDISFLNTTTREVLSFVERFGDQVPFEVQSISCVRNSQEGLLIGTKNGQLGIFSRGEFQWITVDYPMKELRSIEPIGDHFWLQLTNNVRDSFRWILVDADGTPLAEAPLKFKSKMSRVGRASDSRVWYAHMEPDSDIQMLALGRTSAKLIDTLLTSRTYDKAKITNADFFHIGPQQEFYLSSLGGEFSLSQLGKQAFTYHFSTNEIAQRICRKVISTKDNNLWLATSSGLYVIEWKPKSFQRLLVKERFAPSTRGLWEEKGILIANTYQGSFQLDLNEPDQYSRLPFLPEDEVAIALHKDQRGFYFFGTRQRIYRWDKAKNEVITYPMTSNQSAYGPETFVETSNGLLFHTKRGIGFLDFQTEEIKLEQADQINVQWFGSFAKEFANKHIINAFQKDQSGRIWCLTTAGIFQFDFENGLHHRLSSLDTASQYLPADNFRHFYEDNDGAFWFCTSDNGLVHWDPKAKSGQHYQVFNTQNGLASNILYSIFGDDLGKLWISSNYGLIQFDKRTQRSIQYLPKDGLTAEDFNRVSHFQSADGRIFFGSLSGITSFYPQEFADQWSKDLHIPLRIQKCEVYNAQKKAMVNRTQAILNQQGIELLPSDRFINLSYLLEEFIDQDQVKYQYKIEGYQEEWIESKENSLRILGLPYGKYILRIRAKLPNGLFSNQEINLPIVVKWPFYLHWWFIGLAVLSGILGLIAFNYWKVFRLRRHQLQLERLVNERTHIIQQQNLQLQTDKKTIAAQAEKIQEVDQLKTKFFTNVSHEFRTPLSMILGPLGAVLKNTNLSNKDFTRLKKAEHNAQELLRLVNKILDISKLEAGELQLEEAPVSLYHSMHRIFAAFESQALYNHIQYLFEYQPADFLNVLIDTKKLESIIINLLNNALKFTPEGGKIVFRVQELPNRLRFEVVDTGPGIPQKEQAKIFERFYRIKSEEAWNGAGGSGIGLSICMEFSRVMEGQLWVESPVKENGGSRFVLECPKKIIAHVAPKVSMTGKPATPLEPISGTHTHTIMVVEDNASLRQYLKEMLLPNYKVLSAKNGSVALEHLNSLAAQDRPQLIVADVLMPEMDGFEMLKELKEHQDLASIPVVMLTARTQSEDKLKALRIGVDDYLSKPFDEEELLVRIENLLNNYAERLAFRSESQSEALPFPLEQEWLERLEKNIQANLGTFHLTMDQLARQMNMSRTSFFNKVKKLTGLSPNQYLQESRLVHARKLLEKAQVHSVKEAAFRVGIKNVKYFSKLFKKRFGDLPSDLL